MNEQSETEAKVTAIMAMCEMFKSPLSEAAMQLYVAAIQDLTAEQVNFACAKLMTTAKFRPVPAEVREAAGARQVSGADRAALAFEALSKAIPNVGYYRSPNFDDPLINATVRMLGGWERVCEMPEEEFDKWYRKEFERTYQTLLRTGVNGEAAAPLVGHFEKVNRLNGHPVQSQVLIETGLPWAGEQPKRLGGDGSSFQTPRIEFKRP